MFLLGCYGHQLYFLVCNFYSQYKLFNCRRFAKICGKFPQKLKIPSTQNSSNAERTCLAILNCSRRGIFFVLMNKMILHDMCQDKLSPALETYFQAHL